MRFLFTVLERAGRMLEYALTGQSDFAVVTREGRPAARVTDRVRGKRLLEEARRQIGADFGIRIRDPIILELFTDADWRSVARGHLQHATLGWYKPHRMGEADTHTVYVQSGLARARFKAIAAHELVHAYEREAGLLNTNGALREGFARWVEYKVLVGEGAADEARRLLRIRNWRFGRAVRDLLDLEKERGVAAVLEFVRAVP